MNSIGLTELNIGWLEDTGVAELAEKLEVCYYVSSMGLAELYDGWLQHWSEFSHPRPLQSGSVHFSQL